MENFLKYYWPVLIFASWMLYRWWSVRKVKLMLPELRQNGVILIDVRSIAEFSSGHAPDSINIPLQDLSSQMGGISKTKPIVVCCATGTRSAMACSFLRRNGYKKVYNIGSWSNL